MKYILYCILYTLHFTLHTSHITLHFALTLLLNDEPERMSGAEVLSMIKFGAAAVFAGGKREPTEV